MKKLLLLSLSAFCLINCAGVQHNTSSINYTTQKVLIPEINTPESKHLGESLIKYEILQSKPAITLTEVPEFRAFGAELPFKENDLLPLQIIKKSSKIYFNENYKFGSFDNYYAIEVIDDAVETKYVVITDKNGYITNQKFLPNIGLKKSHFTKVGDGYFKQEFIYNGKVDNNIKFIYREYIDDTARPAFTQELQYDLNESNIIGFKSMRIEVIKATNTEIQYKVIKHLEN